MRLAVWPLSNMSWPTIRPEASGGAVPLCDLGWWRQPSSGPRDSRRRAAPRSRGALPRPPAAADIVERNGFAFQPYVHARPWSSTAPARGVTAAHRIFSVFTDVGPGVDLLDSVRDDPPDAVVVDAMSLGALQAAERAGLRRVVLVRTYWAYLTQRWARGPIALYARAHGQRPTRLWASAEAVLVAADPSLDPAGGEDLPASIRHIGVVQLVTPPGTRSLNTGTARHGRG